MRLDKSYVIPKGMGDVARHRHARHIKFVGAIQARPVAASLLAGTTGCRFIEDDPREPGAVWCGARCVEGRSYCPAHLKRAYDVWNDT